MPPTPTTAPPPTEAAVGFDAAATRSLVRETVRAECSRLEREALKRLYAGDAGAAAELAGWARPLRAFLEREAVE